MTRESTLQPFQHGDIFAGCTVLNNPDDDHAGDGRILQYDSDLNEKGVLWTEGTTHLVGGLQFGPDGNLWAFDSNAHCVLRISPEGRQLPEIKFAERSFSHCCFADDGTVLMGEHLVGNQIKLPPERPLGTTLARIPDADLFGYGHVYRFTMDGEQLAEYSTATHGGMAGFLGVTTSSLAPDGHTLVYSSETGPHLFQYDVASNKQLPDLVTYAPDSWQMVLVARHNPDGTLLMIMASRAGFAMQHLAADGTVLQEWDLPGPGWAIVSPCLDEGTVLLGNFFTGDIGKFKLESGELTAQVNAGVERSLAGIAQYTG
ncbi:MAG: hypothetical protein QNJ73_13930 [Gammaproteobacteria bacterium]|nr:hypothetical protein [Gammaproteobacteria bacterium]